MGENTKGKTKKYFGILFVMLMLLINVTVYAEVFVDVETFTEKNTTEMTQPEVKITPSIPAETPSEETDKPANEPETLPSVSVTPTAAPEETVKPQILTLIFKNQNGKVYKELQMQAKIGDTVTLPAVPGRENAIGSGWKLDLSVADEKATQWGSESELTLTLANLYLAGKIKDNTLTFYAIQGKDPCVVTFYNNGGTSVFQRFTVSPGTKITLLDFARDNWKNLGWTSVKGSAKVEYPIWGAYTVNSNVNFYIVRYAERDAVFKKQSGSTNDVFRALAQTVKKGSYITLPNVPEVNGYQTLGWALAPNKTSAKYKEGARVKLDANTTFYAVYKYVGRCTVKFNNNSGTSSSKVYTALNQTVTKSSYFTIPEVPKISGYLGMGWTTKKNGTTVQYKAGDKIKITKSMTFYTIRKKSCKVYLYSKNGSLLKTAEVVKNSSYTLPAAMSKNGYTMMGWSKKKGQSTNPQYEVGEKIKVTADIKLYSVLFIRSKETDYTSLKLQDVTNGLLTKYKRVIFVGDSRTNRMNLSLKTSGYSPSSDGISFVCAEGEGLSWLKASGYNQILSKVGNSTSLRSKPTAIIFNLGVNDLTNASKYVTYMKSIAPELEKRGCKLYYMSVNPINSKNIKYWGKKTRSEEQVRSFNTTIKSKLCSSKESYTYIDTYSYLLKYGYSTNGNNAGFDLPNKDDGLHYTAATSKRIFRYCINYLLK